MDRRLVCCTVCGVTIGAGVTWFVKKWFSESTGNTKIYTGKLRGVEKWIRINHVELTQFSVDILKSIGCDEHTARVVGEHLVESNLQSIDSHGVVRLEQYVDQCQRGLFTPGQTPKSKRADSGAWIVDGNGGFGITALEAGVKKVRFIFNREH